MTPATHAETRPPTLTPSVHFPRPVTTARTDVLDDSPLAAIQAIDLGDPPSVVRILAESLTDAEAEEVHTLLDDIYAKSRQSYISVERANLTP